MSNDLRRPPRTSLGTGLPGRLMRAFVLGSIRLVLRLLGSSLTTTGPTLRGPGVVAFHHTAPIDAFAIAMAAWEAGEQPIAMVKASVFRHWLSGPIVRTAGMIPVARRSVEGRQHAYDLSLQHLAAGHLVFVAPEGTISHDVRTVGELRAGAARLAQEAGTPLYAAVVLGPEQWGGFDGRSFRPVRGVPFEVRTCEVETDGTTEEVTDRIRSAFLRLVDGPGRSAAA